MLIIGRRRAGQVERNLGKNDGEGLLVCLIETKNGIDGGRLCT